MKRHRVWPWIITAVMVLNLPWVWLALHTPPGQVYTGLTVATESEDYFTYLMKIRLGGEGLWGYVDRYTSEPMRPAPLYLYYATLGHLERWLHVDDATIYTLARLASFAFYAWALWLLMHAHFGLRGRWRWLAVLMIAGPTAFTAPAVSVFDLFPEGSGWGVALGPPHFALELGLLCFVYLGYWRSRWRWAGWTAAFLMPWIHPFMLAPALAVPGLHWLLTRRGGRGAVVYGLGLLAAALPGLAVIERAIQSEPVLRAWAYGTLTLSPRLTFFYVASGVLGLLAWPGAIIAFGRLRSALGFWTMALIVHSLALELPVTFNRRFWLGLALPLGVLGWQALQWLLVRWRPLAWGLMAIAAGNFVLVPLAATDTQAALFYLPQGVLDGLRWLDRQAAPEALTLAPPQLGLLIPAYTRERTYMGHWAETLDIGGKLQQTAALVHGQVSAQAGLTELRRLGIEYVVQPKWLGPQPASLPPLFLWPAGAFGYLPKIYENDALTVYRVPR